MRGHQIVPIESVPIGCFKVGPSWWLKNNLAWIDRQKNGQLKQIKRSAT